MTVEAATFISQLDATKPDGALDDIAEGDNHLKLVKSVLQAQFTSLGAAAVTATAAQLNAVVDKAPIASPTFTGTPAAPTAAVATSSTQLATTAFVQAALVAAAAPASMVLVVVSDVAQSAAANGHYVLTNVATTTVTLRADPSVGDIVWVTVANGLTTNVIARNGKLIMGLAEDMTLDSATAAVRLRFVNDTLGWRLI
jgi:hypothetical protein